MTCTRAETRDMISLRKSLTELEDLDTRFRTSLNCYLGAIASIEEAVIVVIPRAGKEHE